MFRVLLVLLFWLAAVVPADAQRWCRSQYCNGWVYSYTNGPSGYGSYDYGSNKDSDRYQSSEQWRLHLQAGPKVLNGLRKNSRNGPDIRNCSRRCSAVLRPHQRRSAVKAMAMVAVRRTAQTSASTTPSPANTVYQWSRSPHSRAERSTGL